MLQHFLDAQEKETLLERHKAMSDRDLVVMYNKSPKWSDGEFRIYDG